MQKLRLDQILLEDLQDEIPEWERSFGVDIPLQAYENARTFGDICDVVEAHMQGEISEDCTDQQAFYRLRIAVSRALDIPPAQLSPATKWSDLMKGRKRRRVLAKLNRELGVHPTVYGIPFELEVLISAGVFGSLTLLILTFSLGLALSGFTALLILISGLWGQVLRHPTLGDTARELGALHYRIMRRDPESYNPGEIRQGLHRYFVWRFDLDPDQLSADSPLF